jgi:tetratricopeptide (TPR) repeat protein
LYGNLEKEYILHRWEWIYQTANKDSFQYEDYRINLARKIGAACIISGQVENKDKQRLVNLNVFDGASLKKTTLSAATYGQLGLNIFGWLRKNIPIVSKKSLHSAPMPDQNIQTFIEAKIALLQGDYEQVLKILNDADSSQVELVTAAYLQKGISELENKSNSPLAGLQMNPYFRRLLNLIIPYSKEGKDTADLNIILARMYMHQENYGMAEICLEKALTQERYNPRIYHYMSFLHKSRFTERGFSNRAAVLDLAVKLDPGYTSAVYELAEELYTTGTASSNDPNTKTSIKVLRDFLILNPNNENILALLGRILLQTKYTLEAMDIYTKLLSLTPNSAENHYNMGICYFHKKEYEKAKNEFNRAIQINDYPDSYLYLGAINRLEGDTDQALYYYRERVKKKQGDDDQYAKEAMRGIRLILNEIAEKEEEARKSGSQP